jgi:hypothetical protein
MASRSLAAISPTGCIFNWTRPPLTKDETNITIRVGKQLKATFNGASLELRFWSFGCLHRARSMQCSGEAPRCDSGNEPPLNPSVPSLARSRRSPLFFITIVIMLTSLSSVPLWGLLLLLLCHPTFGQAPPTFTLPNQPEYNLLNQCGKTCLYGSSDVWIGGRLGCSSPYTNDCMCRLDKAPTISSYASECNKNLCTFGDAQQDINTFLSLYNSYCAQNGYTLPGAAAEATGDSSGGTVIKGDPTAATVTRVSHATITAGSGGTKTGAGLGKWGALAVGVSVWMVFS